MVEYIHIMVNCPYVGCSRSIEYCFKCNYKKGIVNYDLVCDHRDAMKMSEKDKDSKDKIKEINR